MLTRSTSPARIQRRRPTSTRPPLGELFSLVWLLLMAAGTSVGTVLLLPMAPVAVLYIAAPLLGLCLRYIHDIIARFRHQRTGGYAERHISGRQFLRLPYPRPVHVAAVCGLLSMIPTIILVALLQYASPGPPSQVVLSIPLVCAGIGLLIQWIRIQRGACDLVTDTRTGTVHLPRALDRIHLDALPIHHIVDVRPYQRDHHGKGPSWSVKLFWRSNGKALCSSWLLTPTTRWSAFALARHLSRRWSLDRRRTTPATSASPSRPRRSAGRR